MMEAVIVRAFGGEPLRRVAVRRQNRGVLISRPDRIDAVERGESEPVCFPQDLVFDFDGEAFDALKLAHDHGDRQRLEALWMKMHAFEPKVGANA